MTDYASIRMTRGVRDKRGFLLFGLIFIRVL
jgi:hypothetical protein